MRQNRRMVPPASRRPFPPTSHRAPTAGGSVRIIGGRWRGSKLPVPDVVGLRPTSDRVRETVFNWLQPMFPGARVLDAFAGSGALGLEAASRGAARVVLLENHPLLAANLREQATRLGRGEQAAVVEVAQDDALRWLARPPSTCFDLVLLDPPFAAELWAPTLALLDPWLAADARLYLECSRQRAFEPGPDWLPHRLGQTRDVQFALYRRCAVTLHSVSTEQGSARA